MDYSELYSNKTIVRSLEDTALLYGDKICLIDEKNSLTFNDLIMLTKRFSLYLYNQNIKKGDRVIVQLPNSVQFCLTLFGLFELGAIPVLCLPSQKNAVIKGVFNNSGAKAYIYCKNFLNTDYSETVKDISSEKKVICIEEESLVKLLSLDNYGSISENLVFNHPESVAFLSLSGGTTGIPKLIPRTHNDYIYNADVTSKRAGITENSVMLTVLPCAHNFPLGTPGIIGTLLAGGRVVMMRYPDPSEVFYQIEKNKVTDISLVPTLAKMCIEFRKNCKDDNLSSLNSVMVGGSYLNPQMAKEIELYFETTIIQVYGMSEGMTFMTSLNDVEEVRFNTQGKPSSTKDEFLIHNKELMVRGPYTITGYYNNNKANEISFNKDGYYHTGDIAELDENGNIIICGRTKEMINRAGEKIIPSALEDWIEEIEGIKDCVVCGIPDEILGSKICVFVRYENCKYTKNQLNKILREKELPDFYTIDNLIEVNNWPLTPVGKINKKELVNILDFKIC